MNKEDLKKLKSRILSMAAAVTMMATPVAANAQGNNEEENINNTKIEQYDQKENDGILDCVEFDENVNKCYDYLTQRISYDALKEHLECLYYLTNHEFISNLDAKTLEETRVNSTDIANGEFQNFADAYSLINEILDYNQSVIKGFNRMIDTNNINYVSYDKTILNKYLTKVVNNNNYNVLDAIRDYNNENQNPDLAIEPGDLCVTYNEIMAKYMAKVVNEDYDLIAAIKEANEEIKTDAIAKLIDVSILCFNEDDKNLVHEMHENYVKAYLTGKFNNEAYEMVFKQLTTLNSYERAGNSHQLSIGARWLAQNIIGGDVMQMLRDHMQETYSRNELDQYFVGSELNKGQWIMRDDMQLDLNCLKNELEVEVFQFGQLWVVVYTNVNNDIMTSFAMRCSHTK